MKAGTQPYCLRIGNFRKPKQTPRRSPETHNDVYLAIALTILNAETGILNFFPEDSASRTKGQGEMLQPGDGIICCGEDANPGGGGEGGIVLMIQYQVAPDRLEG